MREEVAADRRMDQAQSSLYGTEHILAWIMAVGAIVLGAIGALTGFGILELRDAVDEVAPAAGDAIAASVFSQDFWDGTMLIFSAITLAMLAYCLHSNDHHRLRSLSTVEDSERGMWTAEHGLAYLFALGTIALLVIGLLTGFNAFSADHDQRDGLLWIWLGLGSGVLTATLHAVRHHQVSAEEEFVIGIIDERVSSRSAGVARQPGAQRLP